MALLGAILVKPSAYERVADFLRPEHLALAEHRVIFAGVRNLADQGKLADAVTMKSYLDNAGSLDAVGGTSYLNQLIDCAVTPSNAGEYGRLIHDLYVRRELILIGEGVVSRAYQDELMDGGGQAEVALDALRKVSSDPGIVGDIDPEPIEALLSEPIEPRGWLLGNIMCRRFMTVLAASGGAGKTSLAIAMALSLATGKRICGEHVHKRCRVMILTLEDGREEYKRRFRAACIHHGISPEDIGGRVYVRSLTSSYSSGHTLVSVDDRGEIIQTGMADKIANIVRKHAIDVCIFDPFIALSGAPENDNTAVDRVAKILTGLAESLDIAIFVAHHFAKGEAAPGDASKVRGASALVDASRFSCTLMPMSADDATYYGVSDDERRSYVRMDDAKANLVARSPAARWFRICGVQIGNGTDAYPKGDNVHTVEAWTPPETWNGVPVQTLNAILSQIDRGAPDGERYSAARNAGSYPAWRVVKAHIPDKPEAQCKEIIATWVSTGLLFTEDYVSPARRRPRPGLSVDHSKRPTQ